MKRATLDHYRQVTRQRALTPAETEDLDRLLDADRQRQWRLPLRVVLLREKLRQLESQLLPQQARTVARCQERMDRQRAQRIAAELKASTNPPKGE